METVETFQLSKPSPKLDMAIEWLRRHPEEANQPNRVLAQKIGVSHTLVKQAKERLKP